MNEIQHKIWIDSINFYIQDGLSIEKAMAKAEALAKSWPFRTVNGEQTPDSRALEANKAAHPEPKFDPNTCEESPL